MASARDDEDSRTAVDRSVLDQWARAGALSRAEYGRCLELAGFRPGAAAWVLFLERLLAAMGALLVGAGAIYFIAYNWDVLGRFGKFALLDIAIVAMVAVAWWRGADGLLGKASLWLATVLVGGLLALIGQTYQTGADPYELFIAWSLLALPWTFVSAWAPGWMLVLVLSNVAVALYFGEIFRPFMLFFGLGEEVLWLGLWGLNAIATVLAELLAPRRVAWGSAWLIRMAAVLAIAAATALVLLVVSDHDRYSPLLLIVAAATLGGALWLYRYRRLDLPILGAVAASAIVIVEYFIARQLYHDYGGPSFMLLALVLVLMSAAAAVWLTRLARAAHQPLPGGSA
jgi:uncharacterized membrane protein